MIRRQFAEDSASWEGQLRLYIKRCASLYPQGVPRDLPARIVTKDSTQLISAEVQVIFVTAPVNLADSELLLLTSAAERGLKLSTVQYRLITTAELSNAETLISVGSSSVKAVVLLGQLGESVISACKLKLRPQGQAMSVPIIITFSLAEVVADGTLKRTFWEDLKPIMGAI